MSDEIAAMKMVDGHCVPLSEDDLVQREVDAAASGYPVENAVAAPPRIVAAAMDVVVSVGEVTSLEGAFNIAAGLALGPGQFMLLFYGALPDNGYYVVAQGDFVSAQPIERAPGYFILETRNGSGDLIEPSRLCVQVFKVG